MGSVRRSRTCCGYRPDLVYPGRHLNGSGVLPAEAEPFAVELARGEVPTPPYPR
jgi:hypothetical protein